ncbi:MAG TPA: DUF4153 domain-containing protein [Syntrophomonadaceae bacterium]|nr:DUF4153 domain-containing protein [Syntrophomonadaceae bacterium]
MLILYYFFLLDKLSMVSITRYIAVSLALYLGFLFIPYLPKKEQFEMYIIKVCSGFLITVIYSAVLYLGLAAILLAMDQLLGIQITEKAYFYTGLFVAFIFAPSYFLADIPLPNQQFQQENYSKILRVLLLYIVMPLLTAYTTILYIYFIKIIVLWQWPVGLVSHLVLWYAVIVAAVLFLITPIKDEDKWANRFIKWMPKIILPILIMMFISMGIRINAYGVTENRYFVVVLGLWVSGMMLYFSFIKKRMNIVIPFTLALIALISVFGPLSSYSISTRSQNNRLQAILIRNDMLQQGKIQAAPADISGNDKNEISRKLDYFSQNHTLQQVEYLPHDFKMDDMEKVFGFPYENPRAQSPDGFFYLTSRQSERTVDIREFDYLFANMFDTMYLYNEKSAGNTIDVDYDYQLSIVEINHQGTPLYEKDLNLFAKELFDKHKPTAGENSLSPEEMTLVEENNQLKVKFVFLHMMGNENTSTGDIKLENAEFYLLIKIK